jgi:hypothetical protein
VTGPSPKRNWLRLALVGGVAVSVASLLAVLGVGPFGSGAAPPAPLARTQVRVEIVDADGKPVQGAMAYVMRPPGEDAAGERWSAKEAALTLPAGKARSLLVTARGYQMARVEGVRVSRRVVLERGLPVRVRLRNAPASLDEKSIRFLIRIRPAEELLATMRGLDAATVVDLMTHAAGPRSGPRGLPRGAFGYAVSRTQAAAGILLPAPGRYHVHWGLMNLEAGTWFSLGAACGRAVLVQTGREAYELDVTDGDLQQTLVGLRDSVNRLSDED